MRRLGFLTSKIVRLFIIIGKATLYSLRGTTKHPLTLPVTDPHKGPWTD